MSISECSGNYETVLAKYRQFVAKKNCVGQRLRQPSRPLILLLIKAPGVRQIIAQRLLFELIVSLQKMHSKQTWLGKSATKVF